MSDNECRKCFQTFEVKFGFEPSAHGLCWPCASAALDEAIEVLAPFAFHAKALKVENEPDIAKVVSQVGSSYLVTGAFQTALEFFKQHNPEWQE